ncbi:MAG: hypothetical protein HONBIEJF_00540 [Fimbriimonadaceae bacterium]|nr:hypothetical protein [Fimbriimonadaceae bacterium]
MNRILSGIIYVAFAMSSMGQGKGDLVGTWTAKDGAWRTTLTFLRDGEGEFRREIRHKDGKTGVAMMRMSSWTYEARPILPKRSTGSPKVRATGVISFVVPNPALERPNRRSQRIDPNRPVNKTIRYPLTWIDKGRFIATTDVGRLEFQRSKKMPNRS